MSYTTINEYVENDTSDTSKTYPVKKNDLKTWNISLGIIHAISFAAVLALAIVYNSKVPYYTVTTDFFKYDTVLSKLVPDFKTISTYNVLWVLVSFPLVTSFFHIMLGTFMYEKYSFDVLYKGIQYYRWLEYSITAGLMTWVIWTLSGGTNLFLGLTLLLSNMNMNVFGSVSEVLNSTNQKEKKTWIIKGKNETPPTLAKWYKETYFEDHDKSEPVIWWPIVVAFLNFIVIWVILLTYFFVAIASNSSVPWFVWTINIGLFFQYLSFGLIMVSHYASKQKILEDLKKNDQNFNTYQRKNYFTIIFASRYYNEIIYQVLSLTTKLFLTWFLLGGIIR